MRGYCTKWALTAGILEVVVDDESIDGYLLTKESHPLRLKEGVEFFGVYDDAEAAAKVMAEKKVASLTKKLREMKALAKKPKFGRWQPT